MKKKFIFNDSNRKHYKFDAMRITPKSTIAAIPVLAIRDYFNYLSSHYIERFSKEKMMKFLNVNEIKATELLDELLKNKFIEKIEKQYALTLKGNAFCMARCVSPITREKANKILRDFMCRVEELNNDDYYLHRVSKIVLFGSYINPNAVNFADIDIAFELERKIENRDKFAELNRKLVNEACRKGKTFPNIVEELFYSEKLVLLKLKNRNRYISLHQMSDGILDIVETRQIYPAISE